MKTTPRAGMTGEERLTAGPAHRITFADERMPAVLATPWLVAHLEYAARRAIEPCLEPHERRVDDPALFRDGLRDGLRDPGRGRLRPAVPARDGSDAADGGSACSRGAPRGDRAGACSGPGRGDQGGRAGSASAADRAGRGG